MKLYLDGLALGFKRRTEWVPFAHQVTYFYGKMGAGKSSIARLVDFCLGGDLDYTPALQSEFLAAKLHLRIGETPVTLERVRDSNLIRAAWNSTPEGMEALIPARRPDGIVIPDTPVENISDLIFHLAGAQPPRVRKSKLKDDSVLERLSIRDLLWYCYLDQESMDSSFFHLDPEAPYYKRNKSRDVLRLIVGFHQEAVAELEGRLQDIRERRSAVLSGAEALRKALRENGIDSAELIGKELDKLRTSLEEVNVAISQARSFTATPSQSHPVDGLRQRARLLAAEAESIEDAIRDVQRVISGDRRHRNELTMLTLKQGRVAAARAVLSGVEFEFCPRCARSLPQRDELECTVCGQDEPESGGEHLAEDVLKQDSLARTAELDDAIMRHERQLQSMRSRLHGLQHEKMAVDAEITELTREYDSAYLASALVHERNRIALIERIAHLERLALLPAAVEDQVQEARKLENEEALLRTRLREVRELAERDNGNLKLLEDLFLDCLIRARVPGINPDDKVTIRGPSFLPEVSSPALGDLAVVSFSNLGSGGKKTLFKCCFALALHRLAAKVDTLLPTMLIIDSPMKNISERENREQFVGFHELVYQLASDELRKHQFLLIDKEYHAPPAEMDLSIQARHMAPEPHTTADGVEHTPLIPYYQGH